MVNSGAACLTGARGADLAATGSTTTTPTNNANGKNSFIGSIRACATVDASLLEYSALREWRVARCMSATESKRIAANFPRASATLSSGNIVYLVR
jgi:hypothetical protein